MPLSMIVRVKPGMARFTPVDISRLTKAMAVSVQ
jgi:hypothetical protein